VLNLRSIDLNLLPVFEAVHEERNLSRAAERLGMSQSAVSHALTRLRDLLRDDLFVRLPQGVQPTPLADLVYLRVRDSLAGVRDLLGETRMFNPATSTRRFYIAIPHPLGPLLAERVHRHLAEAAPGITVEFSTRSLPVDLSRKLEDGRVDMAIDWLLPDDEGIHALPIFTDRVVLVARKDHPALLAENFEAVANNFQLVIMRGRIALADIWTLPKEVKCLHFDLMMSEHLEVLLTTSRTDYVGVIPNSLLQLASTSFGLKRLPVSPTSPEIPVSLIWHHSSHGDPAHAFIREQLINAVRQVAEGSSLQSE
jgi:DNA-binding transcriptional LysR family regulator